MPEFSVWLFNLVSAAGVVAAVAYLLRDTVAKFLSKAVEQRFEKQMETFKAEIRDNERELDHIRSFLTSARRERDSAIQSKRLEAAETLLRARHSLSQLSMLVEYMKILNGEKLLEDDDPKIIQLACCRFRGHRDKVFNGTGELECREGSSAASSSLRR